MKRSWLLIDVPNSVHRSFHAFKNKDFGGGHAGTAFGFIRELRGLAERFPAATPVFCFDLDEPKRKALCPEYKIKRQERSDRLRKIPQEDRGGKRDDSEDRKRIHELLNALRTEHLPALTSNVFAANGFEADDCIGSIVTASLDPWIVASSDKDLWQLLDDQTSICIWLHHKKTLLTEATFRIEWGLDADKWAEVKALAGCPSDNVKGVEGVGETRAAQYLRGEMSETTMAWQRIQTFIQSGGLERNLKLVRLPFAGCPSFEPVPRPFRERDWQSLEKVLGLHGIAARGKT